MGDVQGNAFRAVFSLRGVQGRAAARISPAARQFRRVRTHYSEDSYDEPGREAAAW